MTDTLLGWYFTPEDQGARPLTLFSPAFKASERAIDALLYAHGQVVCRVELSGTIIQHSDQVSASHRRVIWMADATQTLREFARWCARRTTTRSGATYAAAVAAVAAATTAYAATYDAAYATAYASAWAVAYASAYAAAYAAACAVAYADAAPAAATAAYTTERLAQDAELTRALTTLAPDPEHPNEQQKEEP